MNEYLNISLIENWLASVIKVASKNVYAGELPSTLQTSCEDMAVIDVIESRDTTDTGRHLGKALVNIFLYAKPLANGRKNVAKLNKMETAMNEALESAQHEHYTASEMYSKADFDSQIKWHYIIKAITLSIT